MRQIKFNPELIGKPGIEVKVDGEVPDFVKWYPKVNSRCNETVRVFMSSGAATYYKPDHSSLTMYRQQRSAEGIAKDTYAELAQKNGGYAVWTEWDRLPLISQVFNIALVQSGLDEMKGGEE